MALAMTRPEASSPRIVPGALAKSLCRAFGTIVTGESGRRAVLSARSQPRLSIISPITAQANTIAPKKNIHMP